MHITRVHIRLHSVHVHRTCTSYTFLRNTSIYVLTAVYFSKITEHRIEINLRRTVSSFSSLV